MDAPPLQPAPAARFVPTCPRCGDHLREDAVRGPSGLCPACLKLLGERALDRLVPIRRMLSFALIGCVVLSLVSCLSSLMQLVLLREMQAGAYDQSDAELNDLRETVVGGLQTLGYVGTAVVFCIWFRRSHQVLALAGRPMEFGPNAWGWFFVPIANLYKPYQAVKELWLSATRYTQGDRPATLAAWWGVWILSNFSGQASLRASLKGSTEIAALIELTNLQAFDAVMGAASAATAWLAVRAVDRVVRPEALE